MSTPHASPGTRSGRGIGARVPRKEDHRHLHGNGEFVGDLSMPGLREVAFVRSPLAHARINAIRVPEGTPPGLVWTADDLAELAKPIVAISAVSGFRASDYPILATGKVRFVGEPVALVIGDDRASAEDLAEAIELDLDELDAVVDPFAAQEPASALVHDDWGDNRFLVRHLDFGDVDAGAAAAAVSVTRRYRMARHAAVPMEGRGGLSLIDHRTDQLVLWSSTQFPHVVRSMMAGLLGLPERRFRIIAPDVGGGFGVKNNINPEEVALCAVTLATGTPLRWLEDRWEHFVGSAHARDHAYEVTVHAERDGRILGLDARITVDAGAYSVWPWTASMEAGMASGILPGPYRIRDYRVAATTVATNKAPIGPYRGVARPGACFAIERTIDELAHELGLEPADVRRRNMVPPDEFPYTSVTGLVYDSGDYAAAVTDAQAAIGHDAVRARQAAQPPDASVVVGLGYASYTEQTAHGAEEWVRRGLPVIFGFETATITMDPDGSVTLAVGVQSHGQGMETSLAQVAGEVLAIDPWDISVRHGDTGISPYGMGTFASRSMVMAGGATHRAALALADKLKLIGAALIGCDIADVSLRDGQVVGPAGSVPLAQVADAAYLHVNLLPPGVEAGLSVTDHYRPTISTGAFSYSTHAAVVEVDLETGDVRIVDYVVVEDCGTVVNPLIVDGQVHGGVAQGIGTAMYEELRFDERGQPLVTTFLDYLMPGPTEVPDVRVQHRETLSPHTELGLKGLGEGSAIAPPGAIANAVTDALRRSGRAVSVFDTPITPATVWRAARAAETATGGRP